MHVDGDLPRLDGVRRRSADAAGTTSRPRPAGDGDTAAAAGDSVELSSDQAASYVAELMRHDPVDLHRVDDLRRRISEGSYQADPESLADALLERFPPGTSA